MTTTSKPDDDDALELDIAEYRDPAQRLYDERIARQAATAYRRFRRDVQACDYRYNKDED